MKATSGHFSTSTLRLINLFTTDLYKTLQKGALDHFKSKKFSNFFTELYRFSTKWSQSDLEPFEGLFFIFNTLLFPASSPPIWMKLVKIDLILFYLPHMEYEGSIGLVSRKMKIFFR
jgi:hypothetical protein